EARTWLPLAPGVTGFEHDLAIPQWHLRLRVMIYRKHVRHQTAKNFQLDLFTPDDGHFEYYAVATNMTLGLPALFAFVCGRGAQEKTLAELKGEFALDVVPTNHYGNNSAGDRRPKRLCARVDGVTVFDRTRRRAGRLVRPDRQVAVLPPDHREYFGPLSPDLAPGGMVVQASNQRTLAGIVYSVMGVE